MLFLVADKSMEEKQNIRGVWEKDLFNRKPDTLFLFDHMHLNIRRFKVSEN